MEINVLDTLKVSHCDRSIPNTEQGKASTNAEFYAWQVV